ncbi:carboxylesterase/lipase family protein [Pseudomaricurvus alkylphenolicus]|uniref:carboxylesterase/lipase family protein n=1 Tax=Pseudomaricurvus alkylphenolicus TaxID=1306991 RepID=UPI0014233C7F|nr:carboxylesterase/lipase family protein [Pseudomaricurvus alkylphenolicus]NIB45230.1 carboxylesterase/lipase family protein [Pseudomaricurvus alkylphenolicus]
MTRVVETQYGKVAGIEDSGISIFKGIPYAQALAGENLFMPPQPPKPWEGELSADKFGATVPQVKTQGYFGDLCSPKYPAGDDCLNLNIYTPDTEAEGLPVFVWIHGGGYFMGCSSDEVYNGSSFAANGIVTVTINYRLGALGYMYLGDYFPDLKESDNLGHQDQIAALQWVRDNIQAFGGNPNNVTIGGESAGGMAVATLMAIPEAKGLFRRAIPQSQALPNSFSKEDASKITALMMEKLELKAGDTRALKSLEIDRIVQAQQELQDDMLDPENVDKFDKYGIKRAAGLMAFLPVHGTDSLPLTPQVAIDNGASKDVDVMVGYTKDESSLFLVDADSSFMNPEMAKNALQLVLGDNAPSIFELYKSKYADLDDLQFCIQTETDKMFSAIAYLFAENQAKNNKNIWMYRFDWETPQMGGKLGAHHFLEVPFTFNRLDNWQADSLIGECKPYDVAETIHNYWVSFIKTGDPNNEKCPEWPKYHGDGGQVMLLDTECKVRQWPLEKEIIEIWKNSVLM